MLALQSVFLTLGRLWVPPSDSGVTPYLEHANLASMNSFDFFDRRLFFIDVVNPIDFAYS
ncbi:hypothetical protein HanRHA438_Chr12g0572531 [Helianthus annuus]|nr:hypothetical protein HanRHA438_Chr12g0572531 [Helianthus annuus]